MKKYTRHEKQALAEFVIKQQKKKYKGANPYEIAWSLAELLLSDDDFDLLVKVSVKK